MECPICKTTNTKELYASFPGYIEATKHTIYLCNSCDLQFISTKNLSSKIYDVIYNQENTPGYDRYYEYAKNIKNYSSPLRFLAYQEPSYFPIYQYLHQKKKNLKILEVGCGYGYLTYSLYQQGYKVKGIDISKKAIDYAKSNFGDYYSLDSVESLSSKHTFDLIVANELIEHLKNPDNFIKTCIKLLKPKGSIILATPNKDYYPQNSIWRTDLPPVHTLWISKESINKLSKRHNLEYRFTDFSNYICKKENILFSYLYSITNKSTLPLHVIDKDGRPFKKRVVSHNSVSRKIIKRILFSPLVRNCSHHIHKAIKKDHPTLGITLTKK